MIAFDKLATGATGPVAGTADGPEYMELCYWQWLAAIVVWFGHTLRGKRIEFTAKSGLPLLHPHRPNRFLSQEHVLPPTVCGAYIHRDVDLGNVWIRSGKVARNGGHPARHVST